MIILNGWVVKIKKIIILSYSLVVLISLCTFVTALLEVCEDIETPGNACMLITPPINCDVYNYSIIKDNSSTIINSYLTNFSYTDSMYYINFSQSAGSYIVKLCDNTTSIIKVENNENTQLWIYISAILLFLTLLALGYYLREGTFIIIAGMLSLIIALSLVTVGFPGLTDTFLRNGIVIILCGIGFYFILAPSLELIQEWKDSP